jgi:hypothetical protein
MAFLIVVGIIVAVLMIASMWKLFEKAGKPGWAAIVPIYNTVVMLEIGRKPVWWILLMLIPYVGIIWGIWAMNMFVKAYGKTEAFTVGIIFLPFLFLPMLAFSDDTRYVYGEEENFFEEDESIKP